MNVDVKSASENAGIAGGGTGKSSPWLLPRVPIMLNAAGSQNPISLLSWLEDFRQSAAASLVPNCALALFYWKAWFLSQLASA
jgi:hypothetical protein